MILITGASGKTGKAIVKALRKKGASVRTLVRKADQIDEMITIGACEVAVGDLQSEGDLTRAAEGAEVIYHICPNVQPDELEIGERVIKACQKTGVKRLVYHSVLHPQVEAMPHHWLKMRVEEKIFASGLEFTILQPCAYMQNILANWRQIVDEGIYPVPYAVEARLSIVDLDDVAEAAAMVLTEADHAGAVYELAGPEALSQAEVAERLGKALNRPVKTVVVDRGEWERKSRSSGMGDYAVRTLLKMFEYYEEHGLVGNARVLEGLLGRPARRFDEFGERTTDNHRLH